MGRFELPQYTAGTRTIADAVASTSAVSVVAGGETVAAMQRFGLQDRVNHVSAGGTAMLEFLGGRAATRRATVAAQRGASGASAEGWHAPDNLGLILSARSNSEPTMSPAARR